MIWTYTGNAYTGTLTSFAIPFPGITLEGLEAASAALQPNMSIVVTVADQPLDGTYHCCFNSFLNPLSPLLSATVTSGSLEFTLPEALGSGALSMTFADNVITSWNMTLFQFGAGSCGFQISTQSCFAQSTPALGDSVSGNTGISGDHYGVFNREAGTWSVPGPEVGTGLLAFAVLAMLLPFIRARRA